MKIMHIVGARPQFIKYFPVSKAIEVSNAGGKSEIVDVLVHTGQHYDYRMSRVFFDEFGIKEPEHHLEVGSASHGVQTGEMLKKTEAVLLEERPDWVFVYGDTNSTLAGALAAVKHHFRVAHVEAGLRSFNRRMPEEINRVLTDHASVLLFCPSRTAVDHLTGEGFRTVVQGGELFDRDGLTDLEKSHRASLDWPLVVNSGDVMFDVLEYSLPMAADKSSVMEDHGLSERSYRVLTLHRAENTDDADRLRRLIGFVEDLDGELPVVFPMHPRVKRLLGDNEEKIANTVRTIEPVSYFDMLMLVKHCDMVLTDSGGLQKEAYFLRVPCITLREETEWVETVESGWNVLYRHYSSHKQLLRSESPVYGDGHAAERIVECIEMLG